MITGFLSRLTLGIIRFFFWCLRKLMKIKNATHRHRCPQLVTISLGLVLEANRQCLPHESVRLHLIVAPVGISRRFVAPYLLVGAARRLHVRKPQILLVGAVPIAQYTASKRSEFWTGWRLLSECGRGGVVDDSLSILGFGDEAASRLARPPRSPN